MRHPLPFLALLVFLAACVPAARPAPPVGEPVEDTAVFRQLVRPFRDELADLGITIQAFQSYRYRGGDPNAFIGAINAFYRSNPGFCPLQDAFYPAASGLQFMTLAGNDSLEIRGFLYDQSRRPQLTYAYFSATSQWSLPVTVCETATPADG